jgi:hypothetical protein
MKEKQRLMSEIDIFSHYESPTTLKREWYSIHFRTSIRTAFVTFDPKIRGTLHYAQVITVVRLQKLKSEKNKLVLYTTN